MCVDPESDKQTCVSVARDSFAFKLSGKKSLRELCRVETEGFDSGPSLRNKQVRGGSFGGQVGLSETDRVRSARAA